MCPHLATGHGPTNYPKWYKAEEPYMVDYSKQYEPYIIGIKSHLPPYEARFRGYGYNKVCDTFLRALSPLHAPLVMCLHLFKD